MRLPERPQAFGAGYHFRYAATPSAFAQGISGGSVAQRFSESGQTEKAVEELEKAIRISPEYADAYNNLAVQHIRMGRFEDAAAN